MDKLNKIDILPKWWSIVIWIIIAVVVIFTPLKGQDLLTKNDYPDYTYDDYKYQIGAFQVRPEVVPYSIVLSEAVGYGCWLEIEIIEPISIKHLDEWTREEMKELFIKRAAFE